MPVVGRVFVENEVNQKKKRKDIIELLNMNCGTRGQALEEFMMVENWQ